MLWRGRTVRRPLKHLRGRLDIVPHRVGPSGLCIITTRLDTVVLPGPPRCRLYTRIRPVRPRRRLTVTVRPVFWFRATLAVILL